MYIFRDTENKKGIYIFNPIKGIINNILVVAKESEDNWSYYILETNVEFSTDIVETSCRLFKIIDDPDNVDEGFSLVGTLDEVVSELEEKIPNILDIINKWNEHFFFANTWDKLDETRYIKELCSLGKNPVAVIYDSLIQEFLVYEEFNNCYSSPERFTRLMQYERVSFNKFKPLFSILYVNDNKNEEGCYYRKTKHGNTEFKILNTDIFSEFTYKHLIDEFVKFN